MSAGDQQLFRELRSSVSSRECRYNRNRKVQTFQEILAAVLGFCACREEDQVTRYRACGIAPMGDGFVTNTHRLAVLLSRSKSSVNGLFAAMGYASASLTETEIARLKGVMFPRADARNWTMRKRKTGDAQERGSREEIGEKVDLESDGWDAADAMHYDDACDGWQFGEE